MDLNYSYNGKFEGNILIVGQTGCGKTCFIQNIPKNNLFGELKKTFWMSRIPLSAGREKNISECFGKNVNFKYPQSMEKFNMDLTFLKRKRQTDDIVDNIKGEKNMFNKLIVMDDVLGLAYRSNNFANFLTVAQKINFTGVYVFYAIYPSRSNCQMIISQTKIFNVFPGSLQTTSAAKILSSYCNRYIYKRIPYEDLWINGLYFEISSSTENSA